MLVGHQIVSKRLKLVQLSLYKPDDWPFPIHLNELIVLNCIIKNVKKSQVEIQVTCKISLKLVSYLGGLEENGLGLPRLTTPHRLGNPVVPDRRRAAVDKIGMAKLV